MNNITIVICGIIRVGENFNTIEEYDKSQKNSLESFRI